jgi:talin
MILEAAKSIAAANSALVKAASAAQRELIDQGKVRQWKKIQRQSLQWRTQEFFSGGGFNKFI